MPRVQKHNARETLMKTCDSFHKMTGEVVGVVATWKGALTVIGPQQFRDLVAPQKDKIWDSLSPRVVGCTNERSHEMQHTHKIYWEVMLVLTQLRYYEELCLH